MALPHWQILTAGDTALFLHNRQMERAIEKVDADLLVTVTDEIGDTATSSATQVPAGDCRHCEQPAATTNGPSFGQLSRWVHFHMLTFLDGQSVARFSTVCQEARFVTMNGRIRGLSLWEMLRAREFPLARSLAAHDKLPYVFSA